MIREEKLALIKNRLAVLENNPKNSGMGILRKLRREIRKYEQTK